MQTPSNEIPEKPKNIHVVEQDTYLCSNQNVLNFRN